MCGSVTKVKQKQISTVCQLAVLPELSTEACYSWSFPGWLKVDFLCQMSYKHAVGVLIQLWQSWCVRAVIHLWRVQLSMSFWEIHELCIGLAPERFWHVTYKEMWKLCVDIHTQTTQPAVKHFYLFLNFKQTFLNVKWHTTYYLKRA